MTHPSRVLVIKSRHIGDVLLTGPLFSALKSRYPRAQVSALVKADCATVLQGHPHLKEVLAFPLRRPGERLGRFVLRQWQWFRALRAKKFDWVINTTEGDRGIITGFLAGAPFRLGLRRSGKEKIWRRFLLTEVVTGKHGRYHTVIRNLALMGVGWDHADERVVHLSSCPDVWGEVRVKLLDQGWDGVQPLIQVHPTSRWFFKCWTDGGMACVIDSIQRQGYRVVLTSGPDARERQKNWNILSLCRSNPIEMSGRVSLKQLIALTAHCHLFFGVDTAPAHIAAALNVPVVVLFGPSGAFDWGPWPNGWSGEKTPYPQQNGIQYVGPHSVIQKAWSCAPCGQAGCSGTKMSRCLDALDVSEVLPVLDRALRRLETV